MNINPEVCVDITAFAMIGAWLTYRHFVPRRLEYTKALARRKDNCHSAVIYFRKGSDRCNPFYYTPGEDVNDSRLYPTTEEGCDGSFLDAPLEQFVITKIIETTDGLLPI